MKTECKTKMKPFVNINRLACNIVETNESLLVICTIELEVVLYNSNLYIELSLQICLVDI